MRQHRQSLQDPHHPITINTQRNPRNGNIIIPRTNTPRYQNSVLQKSLHIIRDGYANKFTDPRKPETTTAAYCVDLQNSQRRHRLPYNASKQNVAPKPTPIPTPIQPTEEQPPAERLICSICLKTYKTKQTLKQHIKKLHPTK